MISSKDRLINGTILLKCRDDDNMCMSLRDALVDLDDIMETFLTDSVILDQKYCVGGTILTTSERLENIKSQIYKLKDENKHKIPIQAVAIVRNMR